MYFTSNIGVKAEPTERACSWLVSRRLSQQSLSEHTCLPFPGVIEKRDSEPLLNVLNIVGGWPVAMDKWNETVGK